MRGMEDDAGWPAVLQSPPHLAVLLKAGDSDYPINLLRKNGVDMTKPDAIVAVSNKMNDLLDELEKLIQK